MISVSVFLIVVMMGMGALLNANLIHEKSEDVRSIMDNLNFIMEDMSRNLRTGYSYRCYDTEVHITGDLSIGSPKSCTSGSGVGWGIAFKHQSGDQWAYYVGADEKIYKSTDGGATFIILTPFEVKVDSVSGFSVVGAEPLPDNKQPFVTIRIVGTITSKGVASPFSLQTSVSQRQLDI